MAEPSHCFVDHTSEIGLQVRAASFGGLWPRRRGDWQGYASRSSRGERRGRPRDLEVSAHDRESLLVDWLNEILFVAETGLWVPLEIEVLEASDTRLRARARGVTVELSPSMVKAATFHGLEVRGDGGRAVTRR